MPPSHLNLSGRLTLAALAAAALALPVRAEIGFLVSGVGPVNRSMGGASVAAPLDAAGALYWNPASISGLERTELELGLDLIYPQQTLSSSVPSGAITPFFPPQPLAGSTRSDSGVSPLPTRGLVYRPDDSSWTFGLGIYEIGGFSLNYPASLTNPILTAQPPLGIGLGAITSQLQIFQIAPTATYRLSDTLSVGFAATTDIAYLVADPAVLAPPHDSPHPGFPNYPTGTHTRTAWGQGFQAGVYYSPGAGWNFGASVKSPQWFEPFRFNAQDELGRPRSFKFHFDVPMIVSVGV